MRHVGLAAFGITTAILVPAAIERLSAGSAQIGKLIAPAAHSVTLDGATIDAKVDRSIVDAGDTVHLTLTATKPADHDVKVAVLVMESVGSGGGRVETPPRRVAREVVTIPGGTAGAQRTLAFALRGYRGLEMDGVAPFGTYSILVMAPKAADRLERMRRKASRVGNPMEDPGDIYGAWSSAYFAVGNPDADDEAQGDGSGSGSDAEVAAAADSDDSGVPDPATIIGKPGETARLQVQTRPTHGVVALAVPDTATVGQPFHVVVTVKNPGKKAITHVAVRLVRPPLYRDDYAGLADEQLTITGGDDPIDLGPHQSRQVDFTVTASAVGTAGLYAQTNCDEADSFEECRRVLDGQLDATDILAAEPAAAGPGSTIAAAPAAAPAATASPATTGTSAPIAA
ncbi:MAG TPA: hypothetical protein VHE35_06985, partial [Kofleriaceae bacterium]|nr:hypothetical protein [Kofleriaceae bacterium]